jgi:Inorganic pyrophosphatase
MSEIIAALLGPILGIVGLGFAFKAYREIKSLPDGNDTMREIAAAIYQGAMVFLRREYLVIALFVIIVFALLTVFIELWSGVAYVGGAVCSMAAGFFGMSAATKANVRTAQAAATEGQGRALAVAFKGGSVMGLSVASLGLLGLTIAFAIGIGAPDNPADSKALSAFVEKFAGIIGGFAMGASSVALFARVGGGIYTKGADVGGGLGRKSGSGNS